MLALDLVFWGVCLCGEGEIRWCIGVNAKATQKDPGPLIRVCVYMCACKRERVVNDHELLMTKKKQTHLHILLPIGKD